MIKKFLKKIPFSIEGYCWAIEQKKSLKGCLKTRSDWKQYKIKVRVNGGSIPKNIEFDFHYNDSTENTKFDHHYLYHMAWAARILAETKPKVHIDISSSLYFCTIVSSFIPVKFYDYRPAKLKLSNLESLQCNLTELTFPDNSIDSLSCMHTVEHIGLGRYGDPIDPDGDFKAISELKRVIAPGGNILFVVPVGKEQKLVFNAHRIYTFNQIIQLFNNFDLVKYCLITDNINLPDYIEDGGSEPTNLCKYGCGCFWFKKPIE